MTFGDGFFVHTFKRLVPPEKYFDAHPEYFSLVNGRRRSERSAALLHQPRRDSHLHRSDPQAMRDQPQATVFSVSQNDWDNHCECPNCQALAKQEDSQMGPVLQLVNRVAEAVEKEFPDKVVETLGLPVDPPAAETHAAAPERRHPLVLDRVLLLPSAGHVRQPARTRRFAPTSKAGRRSPRGLWVWDYTTDFAHYLLPFPNQRVLGPNIRFYRGAQRQRHLRGGHANDTSDSELAALGGYIMAKCLWNPNYDAEPGHRRVPGGLLRQGGRADPRLYRPAPRPRRAREHPRDPLRESRRART